MRIFGIGIDIVETARISDSIERFGDKFLDRIYTADEQAYCEKMRFAARHYAARFAAKEAISKTFGTGIGENVGWTDMEILRPTEDVVERLGVVPGPEERFWVRFWAAAQGALREGLWELWL